MLKYKKLLWGIDNMQDENTQRLLELQMEELKATYGIDTKQEASAPKKSKNDKDIELAKLYEDAAEYEEELEGFEEELEIINANELKDIAVALKQELPNEERNYAQELSAVLIAGWTHFVEVGKTHPKEQLELIKETDFCEVVEKLSTAFPDYSGDFDTDVRDVLVKRWETIINIKKEHIKEEMDEIYIAGLKPSFVKRIYKQVHGIK